MRVPDATRTSMWAESISTAEVVDATYLGVAGFFKISQPRKLRLPDSRYMDMTTNRESSPPTTVWRITTSFQSPIDTPGSFGFDTHIEWESSKYSGSRNSWKPTARSAQRWIRRERRKVSRTLRKMGVAE